MQQDSRSAMAARVLQDQQNAAGRKNYFLAGPPCFNAEQMAELRSFVDHHNAAAEVKTPQIGNQSASQYTDIRRTRACSLDRQAHDWVYRIIDACFVAANEHLQFSVVPDMGDPIQLLRYDAAESGCYLWHADTLPSDMTRKISLLVPLNPPDEYEGGDLQFNQGGVVNSVRQKAGHVYAFPSWLLHQVTPVTRGLRYSLVAWMRGPSWR